MAERPPSRRTERTRRTELPDRAAGPSCRERERAEYKHSAYPDRAAPPADRQTDRRDSMCVCGGGDGSCSADPGSPQSRQLLLRTEITRYMPGAAQGAAPSAGRQWPIFIVRREPGSDCTARAKAGGRGNVSPGAGSGRGSEPGVGAGRRRVGRSTSSDSASPPDHCLYQPARTWAAVDTLMQGFCWRETRVWGLLNAAWEGALWEGCLVGLIRAQI